MNTPVLWSTIWTFVVAVVAPALFGQDCSPRWLPGQAYPGIDGTVNAVARLPNGSIVAAGEFQHAGLSQARNIALWDGTHWLAMGDGLSARVNALVVLNDGSIVAGGAFFGPPETGGNRLARWDGSAWHEFAGGLSHEVNALLVLPDGRLAATGYFATAGGVSVNRVAVWDGVGWNALGSGLSGGAGWAIACTANGDLVVAGEFTGAGGVSARHIARWDGQFWAPIGSGLELPCYSLCVAANGAVVAGSYGVFQWNGSAWSPLGNGAFSDAAAVSLATLSNGDIVVGGTLTGGGAQALARWNGSAWLSVPGPGPTGTAQATVRALLPLPNGSYIAGGQFSGTSGGLGINVGVWANGSWMRLGDAQFASIGAMAQLADGRVIGAGSFTPRGSGPAPNQLGVWNGRSWDPFALPLSNGVTALTVLSNGTPVAAVSGATPSSNSVSRWTGSAWSTLATANARVRAIAKLPAGGFVAIGDFWSIGGVSATHIAKWNGSAWSSLGTGIRGACYCVAVLPNDDIAVGGDFTSSDGDTVLRVARWNGQAWSTIGGGANGNVSAMTVMGDGKLLITGSFTSAGGVPASGVAVWDGAAWSPCGSGLAWPGHTPFGVRAVTTPSGDAVVAGAFTVAGGVPANYIARWDGQAWSALGVGLSATPECVLATAAGEVFAGGATTSDSALPAGFARFAPLTALRWAAQPTPVTVDCGQDAVISAPLAAGFSVTSCVWTKDGAAVDVSDGRYTASIIDDAATLVIHAATPSDAGAYRCTATNQCATVQTNPAQLSVLGQVCCPADVGRTSGGPGSDGTLDNNDFIAFIAMFFNHVSAADRGVAGGIPGQDGQFDNNDFIVFINQFFVGC